MGGGWGGAGYWEYLSKSNIYSRIYVTLNFCVKQLGSKIHNVTVKGHGIYS